jgi:hypothetical protein
MANSMSIPIIFKSDNKGIQEATGGLDKLKGALGGIAGGATVAAAAIGAAITAVANYAVDATKAAADARKITAGLETILGNTGSFGETADEIKATTKELMDFNKILGESVGVDDEVFSALQRNWASVPSIARMGVKGLEKLTTVAADVAAGTGNDLESIATAFSKAFEDPETAIAKLKKTGVFFTQDQQDYYDALVKTGDAAKAQGFLIETMGNKFRGVAQAIASPFDRLDVILGNVQETIGDALLPTFDKILPQFGQLIADMVASPEFVKFLDDLGKGFEKIAPLLPDIVKSLGDFVKNILPTIMQNTPAMIQLFGGVVKLLSGLASAANWVSQNFPNFNPIKLDPFWSKMLDLGGNLDNLFGAGPSTSSNQASSSVNINVQTLVPTAETGRVIANSLQQYQNTGGYVGSVR